MTREPLVAFTVPGPCAPCPRPRVTKGKVYYPPTYEQWRKDALWLIPIMDWEGPVWVEVMFYGAAALADIDNLLKTVLDIGTGRLWKDDRQVEKVVAEKLPVVNSRDKRTEIRAGLL